MNNNDTGENINTGVNNQSQNDNINIGFHVLAHTYGEWIITPTLLTIIPIQIIWPILTPMTLSAVRI